MGGVETFFYWGDLAYRIKSGIYTSHMPTEPVFHPLQFIVLLSCPAPLPLYTVDTLANENANLRLPMSGCIRYAFNSKGFPRGSCWLSLKNIQGKVCRTSCFQVGGLRIIALVISLSLIMEYI